MSCFRNRVWRMVAVGGVAVGLAAMVWAGPVPRDSGALPRTQTGTFIVSEIALRMDPARPLRVLPVRIEAASDADVVAAVESDNASVVAVERGARILPGQTMGYAVVRAVGVGEATLRTGTAEVKVRVVAGKGGEDAGMAFGPTPRLVSPTAGAAVWGTVQIGAATWREAGEVTPTLRLRVGGDHGAMLEPIWMNTAAEGPLALAAFSVDLSGRGAGPCELRVVRVDDRGVEHAGEAAVVQVVTPDSAAIVGGECEIDYGIILPGQNGPPKPVGSVGKDKNASDGKYFNNAAAEPRFRYEVEVPSDKGAGWYQVMLTAGGDAACAALPSVGLTIDEAQRPITSSAIAQPSWHRTPIGTPVLLEPGRRVIRCDFVNDFSARGTDRNLRLDRIEIARVADAGGTNTSKDKGAMNDGGAMMAMQGGDQMMMNGGGTPSASGAWPASARAATRPPVRIAFDRPIDGLTVMGEIEVRGTVWWEDQKNAPPPQVVLMVNGRERARQRSDAPRFALAPECLAAGDNTVQLVAVADSGLRSETAVQRIVLPQALARTHTSESVRQSRRLTVHDAVWTPSFSKALRDNAGGEQRKSGVLASSSMMMVELPPDLHGDFDVWVECRSNIKPGGAERRVDLELSSGSVDEAMGPPRPVASRTAPHWLDAHRFTTDAAPLTLGAGPKRLWIDVPGADGKWSPGKGSKEAVYVQAIRLVERSARTDVGPDATLAYPAERQELFGADALVATVTAGNPLEWAEPVLDGETPEGARFDLKRTGGLGRVVVPLSLRGVSAGEHRVALRMGDSRGHVVQTLGRVVTVLGHAPEGGTVYERSVTILDRFAYGPDARELGDILAMGIDHYLESRLASGTGFDASDAAAMDLAGVRYTNLRSGYDVPRRAVQQAIATGNPVRNRFTLWAENHFSTWVRKDEAWRKWDEHERFSALGVATFYDLLSASATSPAMLRYLDQERSYAGKLNENYAREIMELHTLGVHGGYTQQDVTNLAHVLTGWTTARVAMASVPEATADEDGLVEEFRFEPAVASRLSEMRDVVGYRFAPQEKADQYGRVLLALEVLCAHPSTAKFVCTKLASHYVGVPAPEGLVSDLASVFERTGGDMKEVLLAMSRHPAFWAAAASQRRLSHPTDYAFRLARCAGWSAPGEIGDFLGACGHGLFDRPTPDGYPEVDTEAMDSNAILQRWKLASKADGAIADGLPPGIRWSEGPLTDATRQFVVDVLAMRLTGRLLGEASNTEALKVLEQAAPPTAANTPVDQRNHDGQVKTCAAFIAQLPEANVR